MSLTVNRNIKKLHQIKIEDAVLKYRHLMFTDFDRLYRQSVVNGKLNEEDYGKFAVRCMEAMVEDWEGVLDEYTKEPIEFDKSYVSGLKTSGILAFFTKILVPEMKRHGLTEGIKGKKQSELKNSESLSGF